MAGVGPPERQLADVGAVGNRRRLDVAQHRVAKGDAVLCVYVFVPQVLVIKPVISSQLTAASSNMDFGEPIHSSTAWLW